MYHAQKYSGSMNMSSKNNIRNQQVCRQLSLRQLVPFFLQRTCLSSQLCHNQNIQMDTLQPVVYSRVNALQTSSFTNKKTH